MKIANLLVKCYVNGKFSAKIPVELKKFCSELCQGKAMVAYSRPQQRKEEEGEWLRGERDQIKFIELRFEKIMLVSVKDGRIWN